LTDQAGLLSPPAFSRSLQTPRNLLLSIGHVEMGEPQQVVIFALEIIHRVHLADDPSDAVAARKAKTPSGDEWN
jgi:hypothetical protein